MSNLPGDDDSRSGDFDNSTVFCKHGFEIRLLFGELSLGFMEVSLLMAIGADVDKIGIGAVFFEENPGGGLLERLVCLSSLPGGGVDSKGPLPLLCVFEVLLLLFSGLSLSVAIF